ncbi:MAG TPA: DUF4136 domain-containing protein [Candidatus Dormibacteraeota bacterium]|nr:DUF4136 domain-containing protein [Candidatus Dormibacteraeota bacterium]
MRHLSKQLPFVVAAILFLGLGFSGCDDRLERFRDPDVPIPHGATWAWRPSTPQRRVISRDDNRPYDRRDEYQRDRRDDYRRDDRNDDYRRDDSDDEYRNRNDRRDRDEARDTYRRDDRRRREDSENLDNDMVRGRIRVAIEKELARKGLRRVDDSRDAEFLVDYRAGIHGENRTVERVYPGGFPGLVCGPFGCWDSWGYGPPEVTYENIHFREGMIVFNFIQHSSNKIAYRAIGEKHVNRSYFKQGNIDEAVQNLLKDLKPGTGQIKTRRWD